MVKIQAHDEIDRSITETNESDDNLSKTKPYLLTDDKFKLIRQFQAEILKHLEMMPSLRKVINALVTEKNLDNLKEEFIKDL